MALELVVAAAAVPLAARAMDRWSRHGIFGAGLRTLFAGLAFYVPAVALAPLAEDWRTSDLLVSAIFFALHVAPWSVPSFFILRWLVKPIEQAEGDEGDEGDA